MIPYPPPPYSLPIVIPITPILNSRSITHRGISCSWSIWIAGCSCFMYASSSARSWSHRAVSSGPTSGYGSTMFAWNLPQKRFFTNPIESGSGPSSASASAISLRSFSLTPFIDFRSAISRTPHPGQHRALLG